MLVDKKDLFNKENKNIFSKIDAQIFKTIKFWKKENDVTWDMEEKIKKIINNKKWVFICNWYNFENIKNYLKFGKWKGTLVF